MASLEDDHPFAPVAYESRLIAFFDVLGWRAAISRAGDDPHRIGRLAVVVRLFSAAFLPSSVRQSATRLSSFSDNVVVTFPADPEDLLRRLQAIAWIQAGAAMIGFNLRGAVTVGDIHHEENVVFGPGLVRAHHLESQIAHYPRILLDGDIPQLAELESDLVARDGELRFLDPFTPAFIDRHENPKSAEQFAAYNEHFGEDLAPPAAESRAATLCAGSWRSCLRISPPHGSRAPSTNWPGSSIGSHRGLIFRCGPGTFQPAARSIRLRAHPDRSLIRNARAWNRNPPLPFLLPAAMRAHIPSGSFSASEGRALAGEFSPAGVFRV